MQIAKLFARIGLKVDSDKLKKFKEQLGNVVNTFKVAGVAAAAFTASVVAISKEAMDAAAAFKQFESETGASAQQLQRWQAVADQTNNSGEALAQTIRNIAQNREAIRLGKGNISAFQMLGIDPNQDPFQILEQLRDKTRGMNEAMRKNILAGAGVSSELLRVLELSNDQFDIMASRAFIVSPSAINQLDRARGAMTIAGNAFEYIKTQIAAGLSPVVEKLSLQFADFVKTHEKEIVQFFKDGADIIVKFGKAVGDVISWIDNFIRSTVGWEVAIGAIIAIFVAMNSAVLLPVAGIILLIGLLQDLIYYSQGKKSLFGLLVEKFPLLGSIFDAVTVPLKEIVELIGAIVSGDQGKIDEILDSWGLFGDLLRTIGDIAGHLFNILEDIFTLDFGGIVGEIGGILEDIWGFFGDVGKEIENFFTGGPEPVPLTPEEEAQARAMLNQLMERSPMARQAFEPNVGSPTPTPTPSATQINNINVRIDGSSSPAETADRTAREVQRAVSETRIVQ